MVWIYGIIGLLIFFYLLFKGAGTSDQVTMEIGLAIAFLAATIGFDLDYRLQLAAVGLVIMLFLYKGFVQDPPPSNS
jgi:hypothetical protein